VQAPINEVKNKYEVEYTPFLSFLCSWRLDGLRAGQPGLDYRQGQYVSLIHNVEIGSAGPTQVPIHWVPGALGVKTFANYMYFYIIYLISRVPSFLIESRATPGISSSNIKFHFVPHKKHFTSPLQRPMQLGKQSLFISWTTRNTQIHSVGRMQSFSVLK
jgi:hypothetical protein